MPMRRWTARLRGNDDVLEGTRTPPMANIRTNIVKTNIIAPLPAPHSVHQTAPFSDRDGRTFHTQRPPLLTPARSTPS